MNRSTFTYALMQGAEWAADGCIYCYSSFFLLSCGLSNTAIGVLLGLAAGLSFFAQILLGEFLNQRGRNSLRRFLLICGALLLANNLLLLLCMPLAAAVSLFVANILLLQIFPAFMNSAAVYELRSGVPVNYGVGRGFGSLGYAFGAVVVGKLILRRGKRSIFIMGAIFSAVLIGGIWSFFRSADQFRFRSDIPSLPPRPSLKRSFNIRFLSAYPRFTVLLAAVILLMTGHTCMSNFLYQIVSSKGGDAGYTGMASAIAACAEVPALFLFDRVMKWLGQDKWLKLSCVLLTVKMLVAFLSRSLDMLLFSELLQLGYGLFAVSSVYYAGAVIPLEDSISAQAYLNAASTLGVLLSLLSGGLILDHFGVSALLLLALIALLVGMGLILWAAEPVRRTA